jgi:multidrug efflux system membrane fusion protein
LLKAFMSNYTRLGIGVLLLASGGGAWFAFARAESKSAPEKPARGAASAPAIPVAVATVERRDVPIYLNGLGTVQGFNTVTVRSQVDGQLINVPFKEGQVVHKGDLLAEVDPRIYQAQLEQAQSKEKQDQAKELQDRAKQNVDESKVKQDQAKKAQDQAKKRQDEANLANARLNLKRNQEAVTAGAVTEQAVTDQRSIVEQLEAQIQGDDAAIQADDAAIQSDLATIEADKALIQADEATVQADHSAVNYQLTILSYTRIKSPIDGRVGIRNVDAGNIVHTNETNGIVTVTQFTPISVIFTLPQQDLTNIIRRMAEEELTVIAVKKDGKTELDRGTLQLIDNQIDQSTGTIRLKAKFSNSKGLLWPGGFVNVRLLVETLRDSTVVAAPAVQQGADSTYVYVVKADQTVEPRTVKVSRVQDGEALLESGVVPGEQVVLSGQDRLTAGTKVSISRSSGESIEKPRPSDALGPAEPAKKIGAAR